MGNRCSWWLLLHQGGQNFSCPTFVKFSQSDGVPVGVRPLMLAIAHVKQPISGAVSILPANDIILFQALSNDAILMETRLDVNKKRNSRILHR